MCSAKSSLSPLFLMGLIAFGGMNCASSTPAPDEPAPQSTGDTPDKAAEVDPETALPEIEIPYEKFVLDNGLTVIVHEDHKLPVVAVNVWYHVGSKDEYPGKTGFAHLFEHLMFQGSENYDGEFFAPLEKLGATHMNGTTNNDRTNYFQTVPTSGLDATLWMESDRMGHFSGAISQARLDEQRGVVQNEKRQGENRPYGKSWQLIPPNTYPAEHPYSWPVIGSMADLNAASLQDVKSWFAEYYGASNAVIVLAGDITPEEARTKVEKYFGDIAPGSAVNHRGPWVAKLTERRELTTYDQVPQARVNYVYNVPQYGSADAEYLRLAARLLADGKNSRLHKRLVYTDQLATDVYAFLSDGEISSQFLLIADARPGVALEEVQKALEEELARFLKEGPTAEELQRAKMSYFAETVSALERVGGFGGKSDRLARGQVLLDDPDAFKKLMDITRSASRAQVQQTADAWLSGGVFVLKVLPNPNYQAAKEPGAQRDHVPESGKAPAVDLPALQRAKLSNGIEVVLAERHDVPMVRIGLLSRGGFAADPRDKLGLAALTMDVLDEGTEQYTSLELDAELEALGASLDSGVSIDQSYVTLSTLKTSLKPAIDLFSDVVLHPAFAEDEFERVQKKFLANIEQEKARPYTQAMRLLGPLVYGEQHPYGVPLTGSGTTESVESLSRDDLADFYKQALRPDGATFIVVGDTTMEQVKPLLEAQFGAWKVDAPRIDVPSAQAQRPDKVRVILIDKPGAGQSLIVASDIFAPRTQIDQLAVNAMNDVIGGTFTSRLNMNLREDKHWSYGARTNILETSRKQLFSAYAGVQADKTIESMLEMKKEIDGLVGARPITAEELTKIQQNRTRKLPGQNETLAQLYGHIRQVVEYALPDDYWDTYSARVNQLDLAALNTAARQVIDPDALTWIVVGPRAEIEQKIRDLNFGEVIVLGEDDTLKP